jgi:hypothetical protein
MRTLSGILYWREEIDHCLSQLRIGYPARMADQLDTQSNENANPDHERLENELQVFELMIAGYVGSILRAARQIPPDKWNWSFSNHTPTAREVCEHTFLWLWCDRQQLLVSDRSQHRPTPTLPPDQMSMIQLLEAEGQEWRRLVRLLKTEELAEERESWDGEMRLVRSFLFHMGQNVVYKAGQIWMLAFELNPIDEETYTAPYPNQMYGFTDAAPWPSPRV